MPSAVTDKVASMVPGNAMHVINLLHLEITARFNTIFIKNALIFANLSKAGQLLGYVPQFHTDGSIKLYRVEIYGLRTGEQPAAGILDLITGCKVDSGLASARCGEHSSLCDCPEGEGEVPS